MIRTPKPVVLITGSSGLIGRRLSERSVDAYHVVGFDRAGGPPPSPLIEHLSVDLTWSDSVTEGVQTTLARHDARGASVIHLAAYSDCSGEPNPRYAVYEPQITSTIGMASTSKSRLSRNTFRRTPGPRRTSTQGPHGCRS